MRSRDIHRRFNGWFEPCQNLRSPCPRALEPPKPVAEAMQTKPQLKVNETCLCSRKNAGRDMHRRFNGWFEPCQNLRSLCLWPLEFFNSQCRRGNKVFNLVTRKWPVDRFLDCASRRCKVGMVLGTLTSPWPPCLRLLEPSKFAAQAMKTKAPTV